jgi:hypothetical protein
MKFKIGDIVQYIPCNDHFAKEPTYKPGSILIITEITTYRDIHAQLLFGERVSNRSPVLMEENLQPYTNTEETQ